MRAEIASLGNFVPTRYQSEVIETEIRPLLPACCQKERISVRVPMGIMPPEDNLNWHQDGGGTEGTTRHMVIWASEMPTEVKDSAGSVYPSQALDLILINNDTAKHRQPRGTDETRRWFVSVRCAERLHG